MQTSQDHRVLLNVLNVMDRLSEAPFIARFRCGLRVLRSWPYSLWYHRRFPPMLAQIRTIYPRVISVTASRKRPSGWHWSTSNCL
jgi:hypothetical protein